MFEILLIILFAYIATGLIRNIILIYDFFTREKQKEKIANKKQKLTE